MRIDLGSVADSLRGQLTVVQGFGGFTFQRAGFPLSNREIEHRRPAPFVYEWFLSSCEGARRGREVVRGLKESTEDREDVIVFRRLPVHSLYTDTQQLKG